MNCKLPHMYRTSEMWYNKYEEKHGETMNFLRSQKGNTL